MALYDTRFGLPQGVADYLNQGLPSIQQPYRPGYDKNYGPGKGIYRSHAPTRVSICLWSRWTKIFYSYTRI
jgi:hypothetical protein